MELLFHCTNEFGTLESIITNGFYPSYAKEIFGGREQKVLMVSFSYYPIETAILDATYGKYKIGVSAEWAKVNGVQPVHYTFEGSRFENAVLNLVEIGTAGMMLKAMVKMLRAKGFVQTVGYFLDKVKGIAQSGINEAQADRIEGLNNYITDAAFTIMFFVKNYRVTLQNGNKHIAFFDREWRYIPNSGINGSPLLLIKESFGKLSEEYEKWEKIEKPHGKDIPLKIAIEDIRMIVLDKEEEIPALTTTLENTFGKEKINALLNEQQLKLVVSTKETA